MHCAAKTIEFAEIAQTNDHYAVQGHSRSPILVPIETSYRYLSSITPYLVDRGLWKMFLKLKMRLSSLNENVDSG